MPYGIGRRQIAKVRIANTPIATVGRVRGEQEPYLFPPGSYTFTPPRAGFWKFVGWGAGGVNEGGGSGSYGEVTRFLTTSESVSIVVGRGNVADLAVNTTITFPNGDVCTAGRADNAANAGVASGSWDYSLNGSAGRGNATGLNGIAGSGTGGGTGGVADASESGGAGAPARLPYRGGNGGNGVSTSANGCSPGGGQGSSSSGYAGDGLVLAVYERSS